MKNDYEYLYGKMLDEFSELVKCLMFVSFAAGTDDNVALTEVAPLLQNLSKDLTECYNHFVEAASIIFMKDDYRDVDVPPWAIKLILDTKALERERTAEHYEY